MLNKTYNYSYINSRQKKQRQRPGLTTIDRQVRINIIQTIFIFIILLIVGRLVQLQLTDHSKWMLKASNQHWAVDSLMGLRGDIVDRNNNQIATTLKTVSLGIRPPLFSESVKDKPEKLHKLSEIVEISKEEILQRVADRNAFFYLSRDLNADLGKEAKSLGIVGLEIIPEYTRFYPLSDTASSLVGIVGRDGYGLSGLEAYLDGHLDAKEKKLELERDALGRVVQIKNENPDDFIMQDIAEPITLTIDTNIQKIVEKQLDIAKEKAKALEAYAIMLNAKTGEIISMAQTSRFDLNVKSGIQKSWLKNHFFQNVIEPGSTMKPLVVAEALELDVVDEEDIINCENGKMRVGRRYVRDVHGSDFLSVPDIIVKSSNVGMAKIALLMGKKRLKNGLLKLGFGSKTGLPVYGEEYGLINPKKKWADIELTNIAFGQGIGVTAIQMVAAFTPIFNDGNYVQPRLLKSSPLKTKKVLSKKVSRIVKKAMHDVVHSDYGTGKNARIEGLDVYGKTGTAQKANKDSKGYSDNLVISSFLGAVDFELRGEKNTYLFYVVVDEPTVRPRWGGTVAAPVFKNVMEVVIPYLELQNAKKVKSINGS